MIFVFCSSVTGFDIDSSALRAARRNIRDLELESDMDLVRCNVLSGLPIHRSAPSMPVARTDDVKRIYHTEVAKVGPLGGAVSTVSEETLVEATLAVVTNGPFDVILMNPPFGTRRAGADVGFLRSAFDAVTAEGVVYSLHKSSTRLHLVKVAESLNIGCQVVAELRFAVPAMYEFHRESEVEIAVDLLRFCKGRAADALIPKHVTIPAYTPTAETAPHAHAKSGPRDRGPDHGKSTTGDSRSCGRDGGRGRGRGGASRGAGKR